MAIGDIWVCRIKGYGPASEEILNSFHYQETAGGPGAVNPTDLLDEFEAVFVGPYLDAMSASYTWSHSEAQCLAGSAFGAFHQSTAMAGQTGTNAGPGAPLPLAVVLKYFAFPRVPRNRGRIFLSFFNANGITPDGEFVDGDGTIAALLATMATSLPVGARVFDLSIYHPGTNDATTAESYDYSGLLSSRRSRRIRPDN